MSYSCNPENTTNGVLSSGFNRIARNNSNIKWGTIINSKGLSYTAPSCCEGQPQAIFVLNSQGGLCTGLTSTESIANKTNNNNNNTTTKTNTNIIHNTADTFKNIEKFLDQTLPPLHTGLSHHTEKIIFFGLPFVLFVAILISVLVLIGISIDNSVKN